MGGILYEFPGNNLLQERFSPETLLKIIIKFLNQEGEVKPVRLDAQTTSWQQTELIGPGFSTVREDGRIKLQRACCPLQVFQREGSSHATVFFYVMTMGFLYSYWLLLIPKLMDPFHLMFLNFLIGGKLF